MYLRWFRNTAAGSGSVPLYAIPRRILPEPNDRIKQKYSEKYIRTMRQTKITIEAVISADTKTVWDFWTKPEHITNWNVASDDWQCPWAENDLRSGGKYSARMEAKDGSFGFDFEAVYDEVIDQKEITYTMSDGRQATTTFENLDGKTKVKTTFDVEEENPVEIQKDGWQAILDNFKKYVESSKTPDLRIVRHFNVAPDVVFDAFTEPESMRIWWTDDTIFDINLHVGGHWTISRKEDGIEYVMTGEFLEIEKPRRLKYTIAMPQFSPNSDTVSIEIVPDGKTGCVVTFIQSGEDIANELRELPQGSTSESEKGWQQGFDLMAEAWEKKK